MTYLEALTAIANAARSVRAAAPLPAALGQTPVPSAPLTQLYAALDAVEAVGPGPRADGMRLCADPECWRRIDIPGPYCWHHSAYGSR